VGKSISQRGMESLSYHFGEMIPEALMLNDFHPFISTKVPIGEKIVGAKALSGLSSPCSGQTQRVVLTEQSSYELIEQTSIYENSSHIYQSVLGPAEGE